MWYRLGQKQYKSVSSGVNSLTCQVITLWLGNLSLLPRFELYSVLPAMCRSIYCAVEGMEWSAYGFVFLMHADIPHGHVGNSNLMSFSALAQANTLHMATREMRPRILYTINSVVKFSVGSVSIAGILLGQISLKAPQRWEEITDSVGYISIHALIGFWGSLTKSC